MSKPIHSRARTEKARAASLDRMVRRAAAKYVAASRRYNYDCNTRLKAKPGDSKRHALFWESTNAFTRLCNLLDRLKTPNDQALRPPGGDRGRH